MDDQTAPRTPEFDLFFREHFPAVVRAAGLVVGSFHEGEEIAEESFVRLLARWERMKSPEHARNFVFKVALNLARSTLRRARRFVSLDSSSAETARLASERDPTAHLDEREAIGAALRALNPRQRAAIVLVDYVGYDTGSAARILRMRPSTIRVYLTRGRRRLRDQVGRVPREEQ